MDPSRSFDVEELLSESDWIRALARSLVGDRDTADDVVQETWAAALRRRPAVRDSLRPWLARVLRNQAALSTRRRRRAARDLTRTPPAGERALPSAADLVVRAETHRRLVGVVIELDEPYRSVVLLRYYQGLEPTEIARRRGLPGATVRTQLRRALERLRARLDDEHGRGRRAAWLAPVAASGPGDSPARTPLWGLHGSPLAALAALAALLALAGGTLLLTWGGRISTAAATDLVALPPDGTEASAPHPARSGAGEGRSAFLPRELAAGPLSGRLVDGSTLEPLPHFEVELIGPAGRRVWARTDGRGRFESPQDLPAGNYEVLLIDHPRLQRGGVTVHGRGGPSAAGDAVPPSARVDLEAGREVTLSVPTGPTYRLPDDLPEGVAASDLKAHVRTPGLFHTRGWGLHLAPVRCERPGERPWVRFGPLNEKFLGGRPWQLEVQSLDGLWAGAAEVPSLVGSTDVPGLTLESRAVLAGTARDERGPLEVAVSLRPAGAEEVSARISSAADGSFRFAWLAPGPYLLGFESLSHLPVEREVHAQAGCVVEQEVLLERRAQGGTIRGTLASESGAYRGSVLLALLPLTDRESTTFAPVEWSEEGGVTRGSFAFEDVADGSYGLRIVSCSDQLEWRPSELLVSPPAEVRFECHDRAERSDLGLRIVDARDGGKISEARFFFRTAGREARLDRAPDEPLRDDVPHERWIFKAEGLAWMHVPGPFPLRGFPRDGSLEWMVTAPGFGLASGTEADFLARDEGRCLEVELRPGWGLRLRILREGSTPPRPLPGVLVSDASGPLGRSGADGMVLLEHSHPPQRLIFAGGALQVAGGDLDPEAPPATVDRWSYDVLLRGP